MLFIKNMHFLKMIKTENKEKAIDKKKKNRCIIINIRQNRVQDKSMIK